METIKPTAGESVIAAMLCRANRLIDRAATLDIADARIGDYHRRVIALCDRAAMLDFARS